MLLSLLTVGLLSFASAPFQQFYLAWFALAPWLIAVGQCATARGAVLGSWLAGATYFALNVWWLWPASIPGTVMLILYLGFMWAVAAALLRGLRLLRPAPDAAQIGAPLPALRKFLSRANWDTPLRILGIAAVWVAVEWLWCDVVLYFPWIPLGSTQAPLPLMCQVADIGGPWIVGFWVALPSALVAIRWLDRHEQRNWRPSYVSVAAILAIVALYGSWHLEPSATRGGPRVMVFQSNFPHLPGGAPTVDRQKTVAFFLAELPKVLATQQADLVVLPEGDFPPLNDEARRELAQTPTGPFVENTYQRLLAIARTYRTTLLVGGDAVTGWTSQGGERIGSQIRNSAFFFDPRATVAVRRYDKIHLVPFSERPAIATGPVWLQRLVLLISASRANQPLHAGSWDDFQPFRLNRSSTSARVNDAEDPAVGDANAAGTGWTFIAPICLENIEPMTIRRMMRDPTSRDKQADFIANLSNDGWFAWQEKYQHLQSTVFRCIENRVPMVRSSNTGISGFIDSSGRVLERIGSGVTGYAVRRIELDDRVTFYFRFGDVFVMACMGLVVAMAIQKIVSPYVRR